MLLSGSQTRLSSNKIMTTASTQTKTRLGDSQGRQRAGWGRPITVCETGRADEL